MENRVNNRPSRTKAKYGAVNGVYAPFSFLPWNRKFCINQPLFLRNYSLFRKNRQRYENKQAKAEGLRCFPSASHSGRQRRLPGALCDILKLLIKPRFRGCSNFILADLGVALFTAKTAAKKEEFRSCYGRNVKIPNSLTAERKNSNFCRKVI